MQIWLGHCLCLEHFSGFSLLWDWRQNVLACSCLVWMLLPASSASIYLTLSFSLTSSATQVFMSLFLLFPVPLPQGLSTCCSLCMECSWRNLTFSTLLFHSYLFFQKEDFTDLLDLLILPHDLLFALSIRLISISIIDIILYLLYLFMWCLNNAYFSHQIVNVYFSSPLTT